MQNHYIHPRELSDFSEVLTYAKNPKVRKWVQVLLKRIVMLLGFPLYVALPEEVERCRNKSEQLRALRIVKKLQDEGYIKHSRLIVNTQPDEPPSKILIHNLFDEKGIGWSGKSAHTSDENYLSWPALGEAVERYSLRHSYSHSKELLKSSYKSLSKPKVDIFDVAGFSKIEKNNNTLQYSFEYTEMDIFTWVPTVEGVSGETVYAPWQWFSFEYVRREVQGNKCEPLLAPPITTGAAAGQTQIDAILNGLLEVVERDAFMIYWLQQLQAKRIDLASVNNNKILELVQLAKDYRLELHVLYLETDVPVHTICLVVLDPSGIGPAVNVSAKTGYNLQSMIVDILEDQLAQRGAHYGLIEEYPEMLEVPAENLTQISRMFFWDKPQRLVDIKPFISGPLCTLEVLPKYEVEHTAKAQLKYLYKWFAERSYPIYYREIISPKLKDLCEDISVVMVKVPQMQPLYLEERFKATGGSRLRTVPKVLGLTSWYEKHGS